MDRRAFIGGTAGALALGSGLGSGAVRAGPGGDAPRIATYVVNLREHAGRGGLPGPGAPVALARVPERRYDPLSVAVLDGDGRRLGYLPAGHGQILAPLMDAGLRLGARVTEASGGRAPRLALAVEVLGLDPVA
jgi:hypothetical protein